MKTPSLLRLPALALLVVSPLVLAACGDAAGDADGATAAEDGMPRMPDGTTTSDGAMPAGGEAAARVEGGVQVVEIEAGPMGYTPRQVSLEAGVPARLVFTRTVESECSSQVRIPEFDVPATDLPMNEPVAIEVTPEQGGTFTFICGMEMQRGSILVRS